ncbi:HesA/MoeB/ThiF family protein [Marivirga harenae]|uniref:HesA/MoeB/ThiF family protein n=1 Tax=Marivirga harenae TaxID=2010992 RepID=UPI0026E06769|nr:HesA/MoeB/ThiF family protein [Marivirga harenae]WKV12439.1 HesA/MoeB/ThiF family protein [Marivirga harenae]
MIDNERYIRQILLPEIGIEGQEKISTAKVLVVGAGGLGCPAMQYLASSGVGTIGIVDFDKVSASNLHRQILYSIDDIGVPKVDVAKRQLERINPNCIIKKYDVMLSTENAKTIINDYDIIIDATDMISSRYLINDTCLEMQKPFVYGAVYKYQGQVSVFNLNNGPTYRCLFPNPPISKIKDCNESGILPVLPGIIGLMQATETIKIITGLGNPLSGTVGLFDIKTMQWEHIKLSRKQTI